MTIPFEKHRIPTSDIGVSGSLTTSSASLLSVRDLSVEYRGERTTKAVKNVNFELRKGEILGIAGESGCGKSTLAYAITNMLKHPAYITSGEVLYAQGDSGNTVDILRLEHEQLRNFRWTEISMVFQSAMNALNPVTSLKKQFSDIFLAHKPGMTKAERLEKSIRLLEMVGLNKNIINQFPHELSGGMRQRVVIAMALCYMPNIVIMDEPTTALDVVIQRDILDEIIRLQKELNFSIIFITHDISLLLEISDRLLIMYAGEIAEQARTEAIVSRALHPYTNGIMLSIPDLYGQRRELRGIPGMPPDLSLDIPGCPFRPRCSEAFEPCSTWPPPKIFVANEPDHFVRCHKYGSSDFMGGA
ncbi:MAG: ABC transporter ATP-binding protein [Firmicutes bacterium]|jgi:peptide/nickel transport system ATP-binding protein|nr:ABC transporter ATP-binding protein [Bacillota bacterium]